MRPVPPFAGSLVLILSFLLVACGDSAEGERPNADPGERPAQESAAPEERGQVETMQDALRQMTEAVRGREGAVAAVDPQTLQARLPEDVAGLPQVDATRERNAVMGIEVSQANARYEGEDRRRVTIAITDIGGMGGLASAGLAAWSLVDVDRTTSSGYERTGTFEGFRSMESLTQRGETTETELNVMAGDRFVVKLEGRNVEMEDLKEAARALDLPGLVGDR